MYISSVNNFNQYIALNKTNFVRKNNASITYNDTNSLGYSYPVSNITFSAKFPQKPTKLERFEGCILGGAIGDALGAPVEFMKLQEIYKKYGPKGITLKSFIESKTPLEFTDDTQMTFFTADGLLKSSIKNHSKYKINFMDVYESYKDWLSTQMGLFPIFDRGWISKIKNLYQEKAPGITCINSIMNGKPGTLSCKINDSKGNGGVMRSAPIGLLYYSRPDIAFKTAVACTALTHSNPDAYLSAGTFASVISHIIQGKTLDDAVRESIKLLKKFNNSEEVINKLEQAVKLAEKDISPEQAIEIIGEGNIASEALSISLYSALKNKMNFSKSIETASNINGDSDTVAAITGNIVGAYNGISSISKKVLKYLTNCKELKVLSKDLYVPHNNITNKLNRYPIEKSNYEFYSLDRMLQT